MSDFPHVNAAFINALAEEGTRGELIEYLQKQWNETCWLRAENERLRGLIRQIAWSNAQCAADALKMRSIAMDEIRDRDSPSNENVLP